MCNRTDRRYYCLYQYILINVRTSRPGTRTRNKALLVKLKLQSKMLEEESTRLDRFSLRTDSTIVSCVILDMVVIGRAHHICILFFLLDSQLDYLFHPPCH